MLLGRTPSCNPDRYGARGRTSWVKPVDEAIITGVTKLEYPVVIEPLPAEEGGGLVATVPDLPGCL
jgi:hypothetical protein